MLLLEQNWFQHCGSDCSSLWYLEGFMMEKAPSLALLPLQILQRSGVSSHPAKGCHPSTSTPQPWATLTKTRMDRNTWDLRKQIPALGLMRRGRSQPHVCPAGGQECWHLVTATENQRNSHAAPRATHPRAAWRPLLCPVHFALPQL